MLDDENRCRELLLAVWEVEAKVDLLGGKESGVEEISTTTIVGFGRGVAVVFGRGVAVVFGRGVAVLSKHAEDA